MRLLNCWWLRQFVLRSKFLEIPVMAEAFRRRRHSRISLLALFLYFSIPQYMGPCMVSRVVDQSMRGGGVGGVIQEWHG